MSISRYVMVTCDKCGDQTDAVEAGPRAARAKAKTLKWKLGKSKDFCPECADQIKRAIANAQEGNIPS